MIYICTISLSSSSQCCFTVTGMYKPWGIWVILTDPKQTKTRNPWMVWNCLCLYSVVEAFTKTVKNQYLEAFFPPTHFHFNKSSLKMFVWFNLNGNVSMYLYFYMRQTLMAINYSLFWYQNTCLLTQMLYGISDIINVNISYGRTLENNFSWWHCHVLMYFPFVEWHMAYIVRICCGEWIIGQLKHLILASV